MMSLLAEVGILAQSSFEWTPMTYYIVAGIMHMIVILVGFRLMQVDPENNTFVGAILAAGLINTGAFFLRDFGVVGAIAVAGLVFFLLAAISSGEVLKAFFMSFICIAAWGGMGQLLIPKTPLTVESVGGYTNIVMTGGMKAEPIREEDSLKLSEPMNKKD